jgi:phospholipase/carboxylesterase
VIALRREAAGEPEGALVLFHGRGTSEHDLYPLLDALDPQRRRLGVTLRAPLTLPPGGFHWYVVKQVGYPDPTTFLPTFAEASGWLDAFADEMGILPERTVLGGFSQGAVMSYALGLGQGRPRPERILAMSGFVPQVDGFTVDLAQPLPPVAIAHGTFDPVISVEFGRQARQLLEDAGADVRYHEGPYAHSVDSRFLSEAAALIA